MATVTTRLSIDELRSARARREEDVGQWLPEPIITDSTGDPLQHAEMLDSLSLAMLALLESLSPEQGAVLLLRDVFDYGYDEIATLVDKSEDNVRQLTARAPLRGAEAAAVSDDPGAAGGAGRSVLRRRRARRSRRARGAARCGRQADRRRRREGDHAGTSAAGTRTRRTHTYKLEPLWAPDPGFDSPASRSERQPGMLSFDAHQRLIGVLALEISNGQITAISSINNPERLAHLGQATRWRSPPGESER